MTSADDPGPSDRPLSDREATEPPEADFYRGGGAAGAASTTLRSQITFHSGEFARPPARALYPTLLVGAVAGLYAFSGVWGYLGDGVVPLLAATLVGVGVVSGTTLAGGLLLSHAAAE